MNDAANAEVTHPIRRVAKAVICPVCLGKGAIQTKQLTKEPNVEIDNRCRGCGGSGWVTVYDIQVISAEPIGGD